MPTALLTVLPALVCAATPAAPRWSTQQASVLFQQATVAAQAPTPEAMEANLCRTIGQAYQVGPRPNESTDVYARRILKARDPGHAKVRRGQWVTALAFRFYDDLGKRIKTLARLERAPRRRRALENQAQQALAAAGQLASQVQIEIAGVEGYLSPLPIAPGTKPSSIGAKAYVRGDKIQIEQLERITFEDDLPKPSAERTEHGALRQLYAATAQFQRAAYLFDRYDAGNKKGHGLLRVFVPAKRPVVYFNEILKAARESKMHTVYVMTTGPRSGKLRQTELRLIRRKKKRRRKKRKRLVDVYCRDKQLMQHCVDKMVELRKKGPLFYRFD